MYCVSTSFKWPTCCTVYTGDHSWTSYTLLSYNWRRLNGASTQAFFLCFPITFTIPHNWSRTFPSTRAYTLTVSLPQLHGGWRQQPPTWSWPWQIWYVRYVTRLLHKRFSWNDLEKQTSRGSKNHVDPSPLCRCHTPDDSHVRPNLLPSDCFRSSTPLTFPSPRIFNRFTTFRIGLYHHMNLLLGDQFRFIMYWSDFFTSPRTSWDSNCDTNQQQRWTTDYGPSEIFRLYKSCTPSSTRFSKVLPLLHIFYWHQTWNTSQHQ
jgi:hypothetical protein